MLTEGQNHEIPSQKALTMPHKEAFQIFEEHNT